MKLFKQQTTTYYDNDEIKNFSTPRVVQKIFMRHSNRTKWTQNTTLLNDQSTSTMMVSNVQQILQSCEVQ